MNPEQQLKKMPDRDLLVKTATNTENLCKLFAEFKEENATEHGKIFDLLEKRVPYWVFFPVIIILIGVVMSLSGFTVTMKSDVVKNTICVEKIEKRLDISPW